MKKEEIVDYLDGLTEEQVSEILSLMKHKSEKYKKENNSCFDFYGEWETTVNDVKVKVEILSGAKTASIKVKQNQQTDEYVFNKNAFLALMKVFNQIESPFDWFQELRDRFSNMWTTISIKK